MLHHNDVLTSYFIWYFCDVLLFIYVCVELIFCKCFQLWQLFKWPWYIVCTINMIHNSTLFYRVHYSSISKYYFITDLPFHNYLYKCWSFKNNIWNAIINLPRLITKHSFANSTSLELYVLHLLATTFLGVKYWFIIRCDCSLQELSFCTKDT